MVQVKTPNVIKSEMAKSICFIMGFDVWFSIIKTFTKLLKIVFLSKAKNLYVQKFNYAKILHSVQEDKSYVLERYSIQFTRLVKFKFRMKINSSVFVIIHNHRLESIPILRYNHKAGRV